MDRQKRNQLEERGWRIGGVDEFLNLTPEEAAFIEVKLALSEQVKVLRRGSVDQVAVAGMLGSSQSRIAKLESGDPSVSLDLLVRSLITLGATQKDWLKRFASDNTSRSRRSTINNTFQPCHNPPDLSKSLGSVLSLTTTAILRVRCHSAMIAQREHRHAPSTHSGPAPFFH